MHVALVTPAYNAERWLGATIASVVAQTYERWSYVIVDDGSSDGTGTLAGEWAAKDRRIRVHRQANAGQSTARNTGLRLVPPETEAVVFLDADDLLRPRALELMVRTLREHPDAPAAHGRHELIDGEGKALPPGPYEHNGRQAAVRERSSFGFPHLAVRSLNDSDPTTFAALTLFNPISTPGQVIIRKSALERSGDFDTAARPAEDWDLWIRLASIAPLAYLPEPVLDYRRSGTGLSMQFSKMRKAELYVRRKALKAAQSRGGEFAQVARASLRSAEATRCLTRLERARSDFASLGFRKGVRELGSASSSLLQYLLSFY